MKFKSTITKEVIDKSLMCHCSDGLVSQNCAFAVLYSELVPWVSVGTENVYFYKDNPYRDNNIFNFITTTELTRDQISFITTFDNMAKYPKDRYSLVGQEFELEIPDAVIDYWYDDAAKLAAKIANSNSLRPVAK